MAGDMNFQFKISANFADLKSAFAQIKTDFSQTVNDLKKIGQDIKIKVRLDAAGLNTDIQNVKRTISSQLQQSASQSVKMKVEADANAIRADLAAIRPQIQAAVAAMSGLHIKIPVIVDLTALRAQLATAIPSLSSGLSQPISLKIGIDMQHLRNQLVLALRMVQAAMNVMANMGQSINLNVNLSGAVTGLVTAINELKAEVIRLRQAMGSRGGAGGSGGSAGSGALGGFSSALQSARTAIMQFVTAIGSLYGLKAFAAITDEAKQLESKIRLVTASQQEANQVMAGLRDIAKNNLSALSPTVELYSKMSSATKNLDGGSTALNTRLTDIVSKLVTISGSSGPAAEGAIIQFGQALSGNFSSAGQELNSIIEQAPALADAIAKSYGVTRGELKKLGADGKITAADVVNGLMRQGQEVDAQFKKIESTIGGTATTASDALKHLLVDFDNVVGVSKAIIGVLVTLRDNIDEIVLAAKLVGAVLLATFGPAVVQSIVTIASVLVLKLALSLTAAAARASVLRTSLMSLTGVFSLLGAAMAGWSIGDYLRKEYVLVEAFGIRLAGFVTGWVERIKGGFLDLGERIKFAFTHPFDYLQLKLSQIVIWLSETIRKFVPFGEALADRLVDLAKNIAPKGKAFDEYNQALADIKNNTEKTVADINKSFSELEDAAYTARELKTTTSSPGEVSAKASKLKPKADANEIKKAQLQGDLDNLEAEYTRGAIYRNKYYMEKAGLIAQMHDLEIKAIKDKAVLEGKLKEESNKQALAQLQQQYASEKDAAKKADLAKKIESAKKPTVKTDEDIKNESTVLTDIRTAEVAKTNALKSLQNERTQSLIDAQKEGMAMRFDLEQATLDAQDKKWESKAAALEEKRKKLKADYAKQRNAEISGNTKAEVKAAEDAAAKDIGKKNIEIDLAINTEKAKLSLEKIQEDAKRFTDQQNAQLKNIDLLKERGKISNRDAENQKEVVNEATAARLRLYRDELQRLATEGVPQAQQALQALEQQLNEIPVEAETNFDVFFANTNQKMQEAGVTAAQSGLADVFMDIASGAKSGSDAIKDFARGFAQSMARVAADALATLAIFQILKAFGVPVGLSSGGGISIVPKKHDGGIVNGGGQRSAVSASVFPYAPRYHVGGIAGFKPGEVPAVLMKGEEVLTKNDPRHVANGGGQGSSVRIINNIDPNMMHDYMSSSAGEQVIINMIERNVGSIKQLLR